LDSTPIGWANGILIDTGDTRLLFDPTVGRRLRGNDEVFITHAHSDHTYGLDGRGRKYSTPETLEIHQALRNRSVNDARTFRIGETVKLDGSAITLLNAGHILGSCQFEVKTPEFTAIYTGDINCVDTLTTKAAAEASCDYLIVEATYGHPSYLFPRRSAVYADIVRWTMTELKEQKTPVFEVYSSGKPQEVVRLFNVYTKIPVVCNATISRANSIYRNNEVKLTYSDSSTPEGRKILRAGDCVYVTTRRSDNLPHNVSRAVATGWALRQAFRRCTSFPLSSHADFEQLLRFVSAANPRRVYIFTGYTDVLAAEIERRLGIHAGPLPLVSQTRLLDFSKISA
jgi:putative mRNA 3-end processing factor